MLAAMRRGKRYGNTDSAKQAQGVVKKQARRAGPALATGRGQKEKSAAKKRNEPGYIDVPARLLHAEIFLSFGGSPHCFQSSLPCIPERIVLQGIGKIFETKRKFAHSVQGCRLVRRQSLGSKGKISLGWG